MGPCDRRSASRASNEDNRAARTSVRERTKWKGEGGAITRAEGGHDGIPKSGASATGVGTRALMPRQSFVLSLVQRVAPALSIPLVSRLPFSLSRSLVGSTVLLPPDLASRSCSGPVPGPLAPSLLRSGDRHRRGSPITAERARSKAPRARVVIRPGVLSIWVIANANKDNTRRTIISRNCTAYRI